MIKPKEKSLELSVHQLVDFLLRSGDIDTRVFNRTSMNEGSLIHSLYQAKQGDNYISEYPLKTTIVVDEVPITLQGRADGIIVKGNDYTIDEIKTTVIDLKEFRDKNILWHLGQAKCYAYMFAKERNLKTVSVKLTYIKQGKLSEKLFDNYTFLFEELEDYIYDLCEQYLSFYNIIFTQENLRNDTISKLEFPFDNYRDGQRELAKYAYSVGSRGGKLFVEAPTGIGKTMSTLFPYIKALNEDKDSKIFYLTAKNSGKMNAEKAIKIMKNKGLFIKNITITAKEKVCFCKDKSCNPEECPYAVGYYNKIKTVVKDSILSFDDFDYDTINFIAKKYEVCPFELELDLSLFSDVIICDYNYMFDPISYMKRFFDEDSSHYIALVDEAHNLVDRSRKMYSASFNKTMFLEAQKSLRSIDNKKIKSTFKLFKKMFEKYETTLPLGETSFEDIDYDDFKVIDKFILTYQEESNNHNKDITKELTDFYLELNKFRKINEIYVKKRYLYYINKEEDELTFNLTCLDASQYLKDIYRRIKGVVLFSATLSPISYYVDLLGGDKDSASLILDSPFPKENLKLLIAPKVSIKYKHREKSYQEVCDYIVNFITQKVGNYLVYLPSYEYLEQLMNRIVIPDDVIIHTQEKDMNDIEKENFLNHFIPNPKKTHVGFVIIGGSFGEGIDLVSDRLIGLVVVGIGLSKINYESDKIAEYYKENDIDGYDYAYVYPGMNKVMQAVGRLIRSENDKGVALLIDERYMHHNYRSLFKKEWDNYEVIFNQEDLILSIQKFLQK